MLRDLFSLFPAYAGVIPIPMSGNAPIEAFPRIRGGDPMFMFSVYDRVAFSPHTRG